MAKPPPQSQVELQLNKLRNSPPELPKKIRRAILEFGTAAADPLFTLLQDAEAALYIRAHAAELLAELGDARGVPALLEFLDQVPESSNDAEILRGKITHLGPSLIEPALAWLKTTRNKTGRECILQALTRLKVRDDRMLQGLIDALDLRTSETFDRLVAYGDQRGLDLLLRRFDEIAQGPILDHFRWDELREIARALLDAGVSLGEDREELLEGYKESSHLQYSTGTWELWEPPYGPPPEVLVKPQPMEEVRARVNRLLTEESDMPSDETSTLIRECGPDAVGPLIELMEDDALAAKEHWPAILASIVLGQLRDPRAIRPMLKVSARRDIEGNDFLLSLRDFGLAVVEPVLDELEGPLRPEHRKRLIDLVARTGVRNDRIFQSLLQRFREEPVAGLLDLSRYGDRRAVPALLSAVDGLDPSRKETFDHDAALAVDLRDAVRLLGGKLTPEQNRKVDTYLEMADEEYEEEEEVEEEIEEVEEWSADVRPAPPPAAPAKVAKKLAEPGRNEPCWCGSGKKYKKCHLGQPRPDLA